KILPLANRVGGVYRDVCDWILHAIVEERAAHGEAVDRRDADARFHTGEAFGGEIFVGGRQNGADAELPIQLVQRRRAEPAADAAPHAYFVGRAIEHRNARAYRRVGFVGQHLVVGRWKASRDRRLVVVRVVVV